MADAADEAEDGEGFLRSGTIYFSPSRLCSFDFLFFRHLNALLVLGSERSLCNEDLGVIPSNDRPIPCFTRFEKVWNTQSGDSADEKNGQTKSVSKAALAMLNINKVMICIGITILVGVIDFAVPLLQEAIVNSENGTNPLPLYQVWIYASLTLIVPWLSVLINQHKTVRLQEMQMQIQSGLMIAVHHKTIRMSSIARKKNSIGELSNLFSRDIRLASSMLQDIPSLIAGAIQIIVGIALIYLMIGVATLTAVAIIIINTLLAGYFTKIALTSFRAYQKESAVGLKMKSEVLNGIRSIKYYCWNEAFQKIIEDLRVNELTKLLWHQIQKLPAAVLGVLAPIAMPILVFYTYIRLGNDLTYVKAFTILMIFEKVVSTISTLPSTLSQLTESIAGFERIRDFLLTDELEDYVTTSVLPVDVKGSEESPVVIRVEKGYFGWEKVAAEKEAEDEKEKGEEKALLQECSALPTSVINLSLPDYPLLDRSRHTLTDLSMEVRRGEILSIVGPVGSGKSSIIAALLGEMSARSGNTTVIGSIALHEQQPWILNATLRNNIIFDKPYDDTLFSQVIAACALAVDIAALPAGVETEIGERGINLSGGQKARVSLARALYNQADIYLLDDPLSAVDAHVADHLFHQAVLAHLKASNKAVVLVTHQVHFLPYCDKVLVLGSNGHVQFQGTYTELTKRTDIDINYINNGKETEESETQEEDQSKAAKGDSGDTTKTVAASTNKAEKPIKATRDGKDKGDDVKDNSAITTSASTRKKPSGKLIGREGKRSGRVGWDVYHFYVKGGGEWLFLVICAGIAGALICGILANFVIIAWGEAQEDAEESEDDGSTSNGLSSGENMSYLNEYATMLLLGVVVFTVVAILKLVSVQIGAYYYHTKLVRTMINATISFYDTTPLGRILNLFGNDLRSMNLMLYSFLMNTIEAGMKALASIVIISITTRGTFLIFLIPIAYSVYMWQLHYRYANTDVSRLFKLANSPVIVEFTQNLASLVSLRAYRAQPYALQRLNTKVVTLTSIQRVKFRLTIWLGMRLQIVGATIIFFCVVLAIASDNSIIRPADLSLAILYAQMLPAVFQQFLTMSTMLEANMSAPERVAWALQSTPQEADTMHLGKGTSDTDSALSMAKVKEDDDTDTVAAVPLTEGEKIETGEATEQGEEEVIIPPLEWPSRGAIDIVDVHMRYRQGPLILRGLSFSIAANEKVGIVGRTGSGKSSFLVSIFGIQQYHQGKIYIDGLDISRIPLSILRSRVGIILQDPILFSETVRFNIDPFSQYSDEQIWSILREVGLSDKIKSLPDQLYEKVAEGGSNFSVGQRQLMAFSRTLLSQHKIVFLDEATSSLDNETDIVIRELLERKMKDKTVVTIAHRLHTIVDCDKVVVFDQGQVAEMGPPQVLLSEDDTSNVHKESREKGETNHGVVKRGLFKALWEQSIQHEK